MENTDSTLLEEFISEASEHLAESEQLLLELDSAQDGEKKELIDRIFRGIHSIKGAAGFLNLEAINAFSHSMENVLSLVRSGKLEARPDLIEKLLQGVDVLNKMLDVAGKDEHTECSALLSAFESIVSGKSPAAASAPAKSLKAASFVLTQEIIDKLPASSSFFYEIHIKGNPDECEEAFNELMNFGQSIERQSIAGGIKLFFATMLDPDMIGAAVVTEGSEILQLKIQPSSSAPAASWPSNPPLQEAPAKVQLTPSIPIPAPEAAQEAHVRKTVRTETVRINVEVLDHLMNLASELVLVRNQHMQYFTGRQDGMASEISRRFNAVTSELQNSVMNIRMQPLGNVFGKLPRIVRDLASRLNKQIDIEIAGEDVEVDKTILESLADPLTHMIRNCCDHGIEDPPDRVKVGKTPGGKIFVQARHEGGQIIVSIADDGKGIDPEMIRRKVIEKGLKTADDLRHFQPRQILSLIMLPGFSTASKVSEISGRGVGMDVVKSAIEKLSGSLDIDSIPGKGTTLTLSLPLTLAIMSSLLIESSGQRFAIPQVNLEEVVCLFGKEIAGKIEIFNGQEVFRYHGGIVQLVRFNEVLRSASPFSDAKRAEIASSNAAAEQNAALLTSAGLRSLNIAVVKVGSRHYGLVVDKVVGTEEIVVKPMHPMLKNLKCYLGAMILGDGSVSMILDIDGIGKHALGHIHGSSSSSVEHEPEVIVARSDDAQKVLSFRSGPHEKFAISLALIKRVDWIKAENIQIIGNRRFVTVDGVPTQVVSLDQALNVSPCEIKDDMFLILPKHIKRPFGILASEFEEIEDIVAHFDSRGYVEDGIIGSATVGPKIVIFPDIYRVIEKIEPEWFAGEDVQKRDRDANSKIRILLAEDTPFFRQLVRKYLESDNYHVTTAANGREALEILGRQKFDMLLSDLEMPFVNGWRLVEAVRANPETRELPAIALTSLDSDHDRRTAFQSGFSDYIVKIEREKFLSQIAKFFARYNPEKKAASQ